MTEQWTPGKPITEAITSQPEEAIYDHGYSEEEVIRLTELNKELDKKVDKGYEPTLEEFKTIICPMFRINRKEAFILNKPKEKPVKVPKEKKVKEPKAPKTPKPKKLTAKEIKARQERLNKIIMKKAAGAELNEDDKEFLDLMKVEYS
jgi:hypothetical protein